MATTTHADPLYDDHLTRLRNLKKELKRVSETDKRILQKHIDDLCKHCGVKEEDFAPPP